MLEMMFVEWIGMVSFIFTALLVFLQIGSPTEMMIILLLSILWGLLVIKLYQKNPFFILFSGIFLIPALHYKSKDSLIFFSVIMVLFIIFTINHGFNKRIQVKSIIKGVICYLSFMVIYFWFKSVTNDGIYEIRLGTVWPYFIIFTMAGVMYSRNLGFLEAKLEEKRVKKSNRRYGLMMLGVYIYILFRDFNHDQSKVLEGLKVSIDKLLSPIQALFINTRATIKNMSSFDGPAASSENLGQSSSKATEALKGVSQDQGINESMMDEMLLIFLLFLIITIAFVIIRKHFKIKQYKKEVFEPVVEETRSFIKNEKKGIFSKIIKNQDFKSPKGQVRFYYKKHLKKVRTLTEIMSYETTLEIQEKAKALDLKEAQNIRSLYSKVRYGDYMPKKDEVGIFKKQTEIE